MDDEKKVGDTTTGMLSEFAKLIQEGKKAKAEAEAKKKQTFFEKYKIEDTVLNPFSFISELAKLKNETKTPEEEVVEEVIPEPIVEVKKQSASELLSELASLIQQGKSANKKVFEENEEHLEPFVAEMVQEIVELQQEEIKEEVVEQPKPVDLISRSVESITKVAEQNKVNEVTNLFSTSEPEKTSPNFKAIQTKLKSLEQWVSKISAAGPGSGSYWLNDLGDTDKASLQNATDGQVLTFSASIGKWTAQDNSGGGGTVDTVARTIATSASSNTVIIQGVDNTQNTRIGGVETSIISQTNLITNLQNVNLTQNTNISTATGIAQAAFDKANTFVDTYTDQYARDTANGAVNLAQSAYNYANTIVDTYIDQVARDKANTASANTIVIQGIDATQNTRLNALEAVNTNQNTTIGIIQGVDSWQNNQITLVNQFAQSAYDKANNFVDTNADQFARDSANLALSIDVTQNTRIQSLETVNVNQNTTISIIQGVDLTQNTNITTANNAAWASFVTANSASANTIYLQGSDATQNTRLNALETVNVNQNTSITVIQGVDLTQNTNITSADGKAQAAFDKANTAIATSGGSITGRLNVTFQPATTINTAVTITAANTLGGTGYADIFKLTNSSAGVTSPNKYVRINQTGGLEIINSAYSAMPLHLSDSGDLTISGNTTFNGIMAGYAPNRPGFRVIGGGTTNIDATVSSQTLTSSNWVVDWSQGSYLNGSTGVFTAPLNGLYSVNLTARTQLNNYAGISAIAVVKTSGGTSTNVCYIEWYNNTTTNHMGSSTVVKLAAGDTLKVVATTGKVTFDLNDNWAVAFLG